MLKDSNASGNLFRYAYTNIGTMPSYIKDTQERFGSFHGIISEGVHKWRRSRDVNSLFLALMIRRTGKHRGTQVVPRPDRLIKILNVLDYNTE
jgi:hypothetical protein